MSESEGRPVRTRRTTTKTARAAGPTDDAPEPAPFTVKKWNGHNLYVCRFCSAKDSFDVQDIYEHVKNSHPGR